MLSNLGHVWMHGLRMRDRTAALPDETVVSPLSWTATRRLADGRPVAPAFLRAQSFCARLSQLGPFCIGRPRAQGLARCAGVIADCMRVIA